MKPIIVLRPQEEGSKFDRLFLRTYIHIHAHVHYKEKGGAGSEND